MEYIILALVVLSVGFAMFGLWLLMGSGSRSSSHVQERLSGVRKVEEYNLGESIAAVEDEEEKKKEQRREAVKQKAFSDIPFLQKKFGAKPWAERLHAQLEQAQIPMNVATFIGLCAGCGVLGALGGALVYRGFNPIVVPLAGLAFCAGPFIYLKVALAQRLKHFNEQFPDALDLLSNSVKSGQSLNNAIQNVSEEMPEPVADEFGVMADEMTFGEEPSKVLENFQERMGTEDVRVFCAALQIQRETGGNLSEVLDGLQETIRERFRILRQVKTLTAQGRLSGWIVGILPIALGGALYIFNPEYIGLLFTSTTGNYMMGIAGVFQVLGILIIRKIVNIKV